MAIIVTKNVFFDMPREAVGNILTNMGQLACDTPGAVTLISLGVYTNDVVVDDETVLADLDEGTDALAPIPLNPLGVCTGNFEGPALNPDEWAFTVDMQVFTNGTPPGPMTVYGAYLKMNVDGLGFLLAGAIRFDEPVPLDDGDILKVSGQLIVLPQITPVLP